ncbi:paraquat-inducible protein B [Acetobacter estunensis NRIC 0472]|uniref:MCE family protein n=1 Tax=Acetobacter estunensis TaxID=104097 RepID=A0A967EBX8_9PROT|nr:MlaD family protein [Acetobacter estunensis]MBV1836344.1 MCE family protein [Acetobacter estunensis]NHO52671.1 MCE family protein [Acetobacter estunensis]GBQ22862.1 paraquat-inducible protein B [Acetobacter estunensis NRIC 0472]
MATDSGATRQTLVGIFVTGGILLGVLALIFFGNINFFSKNHRAVIVFQDSVAGLSIGAPVTFRGVRVGSVESIKLRYDPVARVPYIPVVISLDAAQVHVMHDPGHPSRPLDLREVVAHGLRAEQNLQSFVTGTLNINLDFFPGAPATFHPRVADELPEIPTHESAMQKIKQTISDLPLKQLATHADEAVLSIRDVAQKLNVELPPLAASLQQSSADAQETLKTATQAVRDLEGRLDTTLVDIDKLMRTGNTQIEARGADLHATLTSATKATDEARRTLQNVEGILSPRSADRDNLDSSLRDIAAAAASLRGFASDVERNPQLLLMGRRP